MKRKIQRALWGICVMCAVILAYGNTVNTAEPSPLELLSKLRALKTSSVSSTVHDGWLDEKIITLSAVSTPITVMRGTPETEEKIAQDIKGARYIYMTCQFLANPKIIQALCYAKRVNSATIVCVLENKINAQNYITPDYLTQNGIFVFNPSESQKISGAAMLLDNAKVYLFSDLDLSQASAPFSDSEDAIFFSMIVLLSVYKFGYKIFHLFLQAQTIVFFEFQQFDDRGKNADLFKKSVQDFLP